MFKTINAAYNARKRNLEENELISESVLGVEEVIPGSDEELDSVVDTDSVPDSVYNKVDAELDKLVSDPEYDDTEAEELVDDDDLDDYVDDNELDAVIDEACTQAGYFEEK